MTEKTNRTIYIYNNPENKIRFLEQSLMGKDWRATVIFGGEKGAPVSTANSLTKMLIERGYTVYQGNDGQGNPLLYIHHLGKETRVGDVIRESGLGHGIRHLIGHPNAPVRKPLNYLGKAYDWIIAALHDPARANGIINTTSEGFLTAAGAGAQYGKFTDSKNTLQSLAGLSWLSQSLLYLFFAKNNETRAYNIIKKKIDESLRENADIIELKFDHHKDAETNKFTDRVHRFVQRFPVSIGAVMNNIGMLLYMGHAVLERKFRYGQLAINPHDSDARKYVGNGAKGFKNWIKTGFGKDIFGACLSLVGWSILMVPPTKQVPESDQLSNRSWLRKCWDKLRENTPFLAGLFTLFSSSFRLMGARDKKNKLQQTGETIYIGGDVALMFTNSHEYGGDAKLNQDKLSDMITEYIGKLPYLYGQKEQVKLVDNMMQFWMDKYRDDAPKMGKKPESYNAWITRSADEVRQQTMRKIRHQQNERLEHLTECAAEAIMRFPVTERQELVKRMTKTLCSMPWLKASFEETQQHIQKSLGQLPTSEPLSVNVAQVANDIATISNIVPNTDNAHTVSALYDAFSPYMYKINSVSAQTVSKPSAIITHANRIVPTMTTATPSLVHS